MNKNEIWPNRKFDCPYCKAVSAFSCVFSVKSSYASKLYPVSVWKCHNCDRAIFVRNESTSYDYEAGELHIQDIYPADEPTVDANIPEGVASDLIEALRCYNIKANKAAAAMCRRALQKACLNLGADKTKKLVDQIKSLKVAGKLHPDLAEIATEIRILGNEGVHPDDDGLDDIDEGDVKEVLEFALELLDDLYVRPKKVESMRLRRQAKKGGAQNQT